MCYVFCYGWRTKCCSVSIFIAVLCLPIVSDNNECQQEIAGSCARKLGCSCLSAVSTEQICRQTHTSCRCQQTSISAKWAGRFRTFHYNSQSWMWKLFCIPSVCWSRWLGWQKLIKTNSWRLETTHTYGRVGDTLKMCGQIVANRRNYVWKKPIRYYFYIEWLFDLILWNEF